MNKIDTFQPSICSPTSSPSFFASFHTKFWSQALFPPDAVFPYLCSPPCSPAFISRLFTPEYLTYLHPLVPSFRRSRFPLKSSYCFSLNNFNKIRRKSARNSRLCRCAVADTLSSWHTWLPTHLVADIFGWFTRLLMHSIAVALGCWLTHLLKHSIADTLSTDMVDC